MISLPWTMQMKLVQVVSNPALSFRLHKHMPFVLLVVQRGHPALRSMMVVVVEMYWCHSLHLCCSWVWCTDTDNGSRDGGATALHDKMSTRCPVAAQTAAAAAIVITNY